MCDLKAQAPIAEFENDDEFGEFEGNVSTDNIIGVRTTDSCDDNVSVGGGGDSVFGDTNSSSLEDLVSTFDQKITKCFSNYQQKVEEFAPVQVRSQQEMIENSQVWWTITGNFGNILPIDWSQSHARKLHLPALNLRQPNSKRISSDGPDKNITNSTNQPTCHQHTDNSNASCADTCPHRSRSNVTVNCNTDNADEFDDMSLSVDLDMHRLIGCDKHNDTSAATAVVSPLKTADQVILEIDDILAEVDAVNNCENLDSPDSAIGDVRTRPPLASREKLESMGACELNDTLYELELMVKDYSEILIDQLALRDELEYEKELKNQFISLLLMVQTRRRRVISDRQQNRCRTAPHESKYLTTVIPYLPNGECPANSTLQILIKILRAISDNSPTVPTLLTDYILKVLCP